MLRISRVLLLDSFIIDYFRVLPTDEKFQNLTVDAKELIVMMVSEQPTSDELRDAMRERAYRESKKPSEKIKADALKHGIDMDAVEKLIASGELDG